MYVLFVCLPVWPYVLYFSLFVFCEIVCAFVCVFVCVFVCAFVCVHVFIFVCVFVCLQGDVLSTVFNSVFGSLIECGKRYLPPPLGVVERGSGKYELLLITPKVFNKTAPENSFNHQAV